MLDQRAVGTHSVSAPYLRAANVQPWGYLALSDLKEMTFSIGELRRLDLRQGDVVIVEGGVGGFGRAAYLNQDIPQTGFQNSIIRIRPHESWDGRFLSYSLILLRHKGYIETVSSVSSMPHFTAEKVAETPFPVLPYETQVSIADEIDSFMAVSDSIKNEAKQAIELAQERRAALISAAVTGQIDVTAQGVSAAEQLRDELEVHV